jgi:hypothetical protein
MESDSSSRLATRDCAAGEWLRRLTVSPVKSWTLMVTLYSCFHSYLITRINDAKTGLPLSPLSCAECKSAPNKPDCVSVEQVQAVLSDAEWNEYQRQIIIGTFKKKFFCPHKDCSAVFDAEDVQKEAYWDQPETTQVACPECRKTACIDCNCAWHTGFSCDEYKVSSR